MSVHQLLKVVSLTKSGLSQFPKIFLLILLSNLVLGQTQEKKVIQAFGIVEEGLRLDGRLNDAVWEKTVGVSDFLMQIPVEGQSPSYRTEIEIAFDENNLYIAVNASDDDPKQIKAFQKKRDADLSTDDSFQWILDTYEDGRNAYYFTINPGGAMGDGLLTIGQGTSLDLNWDGIWRAWTHMDARGWTAEIRIPFRTLNFDPSNDSWGINFQRTIRRKNEEVVWSGHTRGQGLLRPQNAGLLTGLLKISQGLGLEAVPYLASRRNAVLDQEDQLQTNYEVDAGFDINYNVLPSLKASITMNTDFAETDVDARRINLTRFSILFPEKRAFFLEGSSIYSFAPASGVRPYFSRRIGLISGRTVPIIGGARLLGRVGNYDLAFQHVLTDDFMGIGKEHFTVGRIKKNIGRESRIGLVYTRRSTDQPENGIAGNNDRHTMGADLELNTSEFLGDKNFQFQAFLVYNTPFGRLSPNSFWDRTTRGLRINFPNRPWYGHASYREFGEAFDPAIGFHPRIGFRRFQPSIGFNPLFEKSEVIRDIDFGFRFEHLMDMSWKLLTQEFRFELFDITLMSGERFSIDVSREYERLTERFGILNNDEIVLPIDEYVMWSMDMEVATASFRPLSASVDFRTGDFWSGTQWELAGSFTARPTPGINLTMTYVHTDVSLLEGSFTTELLRFNASIDLSPFVSFVSFIQWDSLSDELGINNRFRWIVRPGNDLFIVYNHNWQDSMDRWRTLNSAATIKASFTHRF